MNRTAPSAVAVERTRYALRLVIRAVAGAVLLWSAAVLIGSLTAEVQGVVMGGGNGVGWLILAWLVNDGAWVCVAFGLLIFERRIVRWLAPMPRAVCPNCEYPLHAGAAKCPECGASVA